MAGTVRVTEKPIIGSLQDADYLLCIADGEVKRAEPGSLGALSIMDTDSGQTYDCKLLVRNGHLVILNVSQNVLDFTLPLGRMRGDVDGDGAVTTADSDLIHTYIAQGGELDDAALWCADSDANGQIRANDAAVITRFVSGLSGALTGIPTFADYYGNWAYVKVDDTSGYWAYNVNIEMDDFEVVMIYGYNKVTGYSISGHSLMIKASAPPVAATTVHVVVKAVEPNA
jgi:hypothetical protein